MSGRFPWQQATWEQLVRVHEAGRLPHGLVLAGAAGIGKLDFARFLARFLMCLQPDGIEPCGRCKSCLLLDAGSHPDVRYFEPEEAGRVIKVDQVRDLNEFIAKTPQQGRRKVAIVSPAEAMNQNSANALLKTLEEPSADAVLILVSHVPSQLLPTIRSRCQIWTLPSPALEVAQPWLAAQLGDAAADAGELLRIARGAPLAALQLAQVGALEEQRTLLADMAAVLKRDQSPFDVAARWQKLDLTRILGWLYQWTAAAISFRESGAVVAVSDASARKMLEYVATKAPAEELFGFLDEIQGATRSLRLHQNPNAQLLLESLLSKWLFLIAKKSSRVSS